MISAILLAIRSSPTIIIALAALLGYGGLKGYGKYQHYAGVKEGKAQVVAEITKEAEKINDKAVESREPATRPGSVERLRKHSCRDC